MATNLYRAGGFATDTPTNIIFLWGHVSAGANVSHLRKNFTTTGYQVTSGKTLYAVKLMMTPTNGNGVTLLGLKMGYADNDVGLDTTTARTNAVMSFGLDSNTAEGLMYVGSSQNTSQYGNTTNDVFIPIAASTKYPFMRNYNGSADILVWCVEL